MSLNICLCFLSYLSLFCIYSPLSVSVLYVLSPIYLCFIHRSVYPGSTSLVIISAGRFTVIQKWSSFCSRDVHNKVLYKAAYWSLVASGVKTLLFFLQISLLLTVSQGLSPMMSFQGPCQSRVFPFVFGTAILYQDTILLGKVVKYSIS